MPCMCRCCQDKRENLSQLTSLLTNDAIMARDAELASLRSRLAAAEKLADAADLAIDSWSITGVGPHEIMVNTRKPMEQLNAMLAAFRSTQPAEVKNER